MRRPITVIGTAGGGLGKAAAVTAAGAVAQANLVVGGQRHLDALPAGAGRRRLAIGVDMAGVLDAIEAEPGTVCVLASGDPGFFGVVRVLAERFGSEALDVHPAPSSVSLAFARLGLPWDDAVVVSAHGRPLAQAVRQAANAAKAAVLTSPDSPPEALGDALCALGAKHRAVVCSRLGEPEEAVATVDLEALAGGVWDPCSVVVLLHPDTDPVASEKALAWGQPDGAFDHRSGLITKSEVRAVALGKLALPPTGVLWDVGAGSGSVAIEAAALAPGLRVVAVDRDPAACRQVKTNAWAHSVGVEVVEGEAPEALTALPDPDRVFVGGGGLAVLDAAIARVGSRGHVVATYAALDRAAAAFQRLGHLTQVQVSTGELLPDGGLRLVAANPVFVVWGPHE